MRWLVVLMVACSGAGKPGETYFNGPPAPKRDAGFVAPSGPVPTLDGSAASCRFPSECASGICEGLGCDDDRPGHCAPSMRPCTRDRHAYCGCDGKTFFASGSCPGQRYAAPGTCSSP
jgi:hypothetical protein